MSNAGASPTPAVCARGIRKSYESGRIVALDDLSLDIADGEFVAICGPSGCGKSTLLNMLTCIDRPDSGSLRVFDIDLTRIGHRAADAFRTNDVGLVFQLHNLLPHLTAIENVQVPMIGKAGRATDRAQRAMELLERVGLADRMNSLPTTLSGGERQRVAVARALANQPRLMLADEPTGALDSATGERLLALLMELRDSMGMTLIVVTHEHDVATLADRTIRMLDGRIEM